MQIYDVLEIDHRNVMNILNMIERADNASDRKGMITLLHTELAMHSKAEEEVFYRPLRELSGEDALFDESFEDHDEIDKLLAKLQTSSAKDADWLGDLHRLRNVLEKHIGLEEGEVFKLAEQEFSAEEAEEIAIRMLAEKGTLAMPNPIKVAARKVKELVSGD